MFHKRKEKSGSILNSFLSKGVIDLCYKLFSSDLIQKVAETFVTRIALLIIGLVTSVIVARILGPEGRGIYAVAGVIAATGVQFGNLGLHSSNTYYVSRNKDLLPVLLGNSLLISFMAGSVGVAATWMIFYLWPGLAPVKGIILILSLLWIPFGLAYQLLQNLLLGINEVRAYNVIEVAGRVTVVVLLGLLIIFQLVTVEKAFFAGLVALIATFLGALWRLKPYLNSPPKPSLVVIKENIAYGIWAYFAAIFSFLVLKVDLFMVQYMLGYEQAGYYSISATMADMVLMLPTVVGTILFPRLSSITNEVEKWKLAQRFALGLLAVMFFVVTVAALLAYPVVQILFGKQFIPSVPAFIWLMPGALFLSAGMIFQNYIGSTGNARAMIYGPLMASLTNIAANMFLIKRYGILGASYSSSLAYFLLMLVGGFIFYTNRRNIIYGIQVDHNTQGDE